MTAVDAVEGSTLELRDGQPVPVLALGVWQVPRGRVCEDAVRWALDAGYRHVDTAQAYGNEESVGAAIRRSGIPRDSLFVTTKFLPRRADPAVELEASLRRLGLDYVDLYLVHWPAGGPVRAWAGMERAYERQLAKAIGVSNFGTDELKEVFAAASVPPAVNQINLSPFAFRRRLVEETRREGSVVEAYSPLGTGQYLSDPTVARLAADIGRTPAQVLLRWGAQQGFVVLAKSTHRERIEENGRVFDFALSGEQLATLDALDRTQGTGRALEHNWW
jgi:diketogulonate reductase-like aldo/keto reductase